MNLLLRKVVRDRYDLQQGFLNNASVIVETIAVEAVDKGRWTEVDRSLHLILVDATGVAQRLDATITKSVENAFPSGHFTSDEGLSFVLQSDLPDEVMLHFNSEVADTLEWQGQVHHQFRLLLRRPLDQSDEWTVVATTLNVASGDLVMSAYDATREDQTATVIEYLPDGGVHTLTYNDERTTIVREMVEDITDELDDLIIRATPPPVPATSRATLARKIFHKPKVD
jgi:hypothetical protein